MIDHTYACRQTLRLSGLRFFPSEFEAQEELTKALQSIAEDEVDADQIVTEWIRNNREAPTPCDLYESSRKHPAATPSVEERYTNGYDPNAEFQEWANKHVLRRVK